MNIKQKLLLPTIFLAAIIGGMFIATMWVTGMQKNDGLVVNLAGRQRMLSQKMTKEILAFHTVREKTGNVDEKLVGIVKNSMAVFDKTLMALTDSGKAPVGLNLNETQYRDCPKAKEPAYSQLKKVGTLWTKFSWTIKSILSTSASADEKMAWLLNNNVPLLKEMNKAVGMMQKQSEEKVTLLISLQTTGLIIAVLCLILSITIIFRIATKLNHIISTLSEAALQVAQGSASISSSSHSLAQRAAGAAKNTAQLIEGTVEKINEGAGVAHTTDDSFNEVTDSSSKVATFIEEIATACSEQAEGINQINKAVAEMDSVVQKTAAISEESASSAEEINAQAEEMNNIVYELLLMVNGSGVNGNKPVMDFTNTEITGAIC